MADLAYAYANARVKAMKSTLLDEEKIRQLLAVNTLDGVIGMLEESPYKDAFVAESTRHTGIQLVVRALESDFAAALKKIYRISPKKMRPLLQILFKQWDVNNLKVIVSSKALGKPVSFEELVIIESGPKKANLFKRLLACGSVEEIAAALVRTEYGPAVSKALQEYGKTRDYRVIITAIEAQHYKSLARAAVTADRSVKEFIEKKISALNAMTILRLKQAGASQEKIASLVVRGRMQGFAKELVEADNVQQGVEIVCDRFKIPKAVAERFRSRASLADLELEIERKLIGIARRTMAKSVLSPAALLGYLHLKEYEVQSLRKIAFATLFEMKEDVRGTILASG
ncbi:MAG: V-type ATPase subunit [Candidatus Micrarchaeota archaeon]|nr:V-type ATPase subunit [Candidatus Micrarchaeota archaeon]